MSFKLKHLLFGAPRNPLSQETRRHISLVALLAWIGLGADGVSSSAYGPEQAFLALGQHTSMAFYIAVMITATVFIIAMAYNQVIELFPSGGGGYKTATRLLGPYAGLVSGVALIMGYILTITISFASGIDAIFSLLPLGAQHYKIITVVIAILFLMYLNLRGMKESIRFLMPVFLTFVIMHFGVIVYGVILHGTQFTHTMGTVAHDTFHLSQSLGPLALIIIIFQAYCMGGGTYTGLEAVSNNVNNLAEPRVRTGKWAMFYMAVSLGAIAGGIILLYLLFHASPIVGKTLNAVVFGNVLQNVPYGHILLSIIMLSEALVLFAGANTGFIGGPSVLANMAIDGWAPKRFRNFSNRLVIQNGIIWIGTAAIIMLLLTEGNIAQIIILYSSSVFVTFTLSLFALTIYWITHRTGIKWLFRLLLSFFGFLLCLSILLTILITQFMHGGWLIIIINGSLIILGFVIRRHYKNIKDQVKKLDQLFTFPAATPNDFENTMDPEQPTAVFFIGDSIGEGMHTLLWTQRLFGNYFKNYIFVSAGIVDMNSYESERALREMQKKVEKRLNYFVDYAQQHSIPAIAKSVFGTEPIEQLVDLAETIKNEYKSPIFFSARLVFRNENWFARQLHNETPVSLQRNLHLRGMQMIILPVMLGE